MKLPSVKLRGLPTALLTCALLGTHFSVVNAESVPQIQSSTEGIFQVPIYKSGTIPLNGSVKRISVGNPGIADIMILNSKELYILGKNLGTTNVVLWNHRGKVSEQFDVEVTHDLQSLKIKLHKLLPDEDIKVYSAQESIILSGEASSILKANAAERLANNFVPECITPESNITIRDNTNGAVQKEKSKGSSAETCEKGQVVNLIQVGGAQQVMLQVKVAEITRDALKRLSSDFNVINFGNETQAGIFGGGGATFPNAFGMDGGRLPLFGTPATGQAGVIGPVLNEIAPGIQSIADKGAFLSFLSGNYLFNAALEVSRRQGLAKILAEPTLTTLTGQEAKFLSGGEFPIPVAGADDKVTVEFKEFGVGLNFLPVVLDSGHINLKINVSVSELASTTDAVAIRVPGTTSTFFIPSLRKRSAASTVELANGQTIGIAGLISESVREFVDKLPGAGDVPVLGSLFRSQEFLSGQTELVIFVTPNLAKPIAKDKIMLPTDSFVPPSDVEFYLLGRLNKGPKTEKLATSASLPKQGEFGHEL